MGKRIDLTGCVFGRLIVLEPTDKRDSSGSIIWKCRCDCGNITYASVHDLNRQHKLSCGCMKSKGESLCKQIFTENNILFQEQYQFENCVNPKTGFKLLFDFYLPNYNCCIEYDKLSILDLLSETSRFILRG